MCWPPTPRTPKNGYDVSVAGFLGYDVLGATKEDRFVITAFQLLAF